MDNEEMVRAIKACLDDKDFQNNEYRGENRLVYLYSICLKHKIRKEIGVDPDYYNGAFDYSAPIEDNKKLFKEYVAFNFQHEHEFWEYDRLGLRYFHGVKLSRPNFGVNEFQGVSTYWLLPLLYYAAKGEYIDKMQEIGITEYAETYLGPLGVVVEDPIRSKVITVKGLETSHEKEIDRLIRLGQKKLV